MHFLRLYDLERERECLGTTENGSTVRVVDRCTSLGQLLRMHLPDVRAALETSGAPRLRDRFVTLPPTDGLMEVWAAGVTYSRSRDARVEESDAEYVYQHAYDSERPELFFKSVPWRVVTDDEPIGTRDDSAIDVPEPELALVVNAHAEIVGYTICNDVSSRSIEGENPLYLAQAKLFAGGCSIASAVRPAWELADPYNLAVRLRIERGGTTCWSGVTCTSALNRRLDDLVTFLFKAQNFPDGAILATGAGIVPDLEATLVTGDVVTIEIDGVGSLSNPVTDTATCAQWSVAALADPLRRQGATMHGDAS